MNGTAFLIFKDTKIYIDKLSIRQTGKLFKAIFKYVNSGEVPILSKKVDIVFEVFKRIVDSNEQKYLTKCEYNKKAYARKKDKPLKKDVDNSVNFSKDTITTGQSPPQLKDEDTEEHKNFIEEFKKEFPNKAIDTALLNYKDSDLKELLNEIKKSKFLTTNNNLSLKWCLEHSKDILSGKYKTYKAQNFKSREYKRNEINSLFQNIDDIEV